MMHKMRSALSAPSTYAKSVGGYAKLLDNEVIYNHRQDHAAPSIALFNDSLAHLIEALSPEQLRQASPSPQCLESAWRLCSASAQVYAHEDDRIQALNSSLRALFPDFGRIKDFTLPHEAARFDCAMLPISWDVKKRPTPHIEEWTAAGVTSGDPEARIAAGYCKLISDTAVCACDPRVWAVELIE